MNTHTTFFEYIKSFISAFTFGVVQLLFIMIGLVALVIAVPITLIVVFVTWLLNTSITCEAEKYKGRY